MAKDQIARVATTIAATREAVWLALVTPAEIAKYMLGAEVVSEWRPGSEIVWKGEWQGKRYEDKGKILEIRAGRLIRYTHYSPLSGLPDVPASYHMVTVELSDVGGGTCVSLSQDNNATEQAREHSEKSWTMMLDGLRKVVEAGRA